MAVHIAIKPLHFLSLNLCKTIGRVTASGSVAAQRDLILPALSYPATHYALAAALYYILPACHNPVIPSIPFSHLPNFNNRTFTSLITQKRPTFSGCDRVLPAAAFLICFPLPTSLVTQRETLMVSTQVPKLYLQGRRLQAPRRPQ